MKRQLVFALLLTVLVGSISSARLHATWSWLGFQQITVGASAVGFSVSVINATGTHPAATVGACRVRTAEISYAVDGTTPTGTVGTLAEIGDVIQLTGSDVLNNFRAVRTGSSGQLDCNVGAP